LQDVDTTAKTKYGHDDGGLDALGGLWVENISN